MKKYIITNSENVIIAISNTYRVDESVRNIILDNYNIAYAPNDTFNVYNVEVPNGVQEIKYCYTENDGFYENPDYVEPPKPVEERLDIAEESITEIELALTEIYEGGLV